MPNLERGGFGISADNAPTLLDRLRIAGVIMPGSLAYDVYPQAATGTTVTTSASNDTLGSDATVIAGSGITVPFWLYGISCGFGESTAVGMYRHATKVATVLVRSGLYNPRMDSGVTSKVGQYCDVWSPYPCAANAAVTVAMANDQTAAESALVYANVLVKPPIGISSDLLTLSKYAVQTLLPNSVVGSALTSSTAWVYGSYVQMTASLSTSILVTKIITMSSVVNRPYQVSLSTGAAASEVDFATVGAPLTSVGGTNNATLVTHLPYPILINASTRIAARVRDSGGSSSTYAVWIEYYPLPAV